MEENNKLVAIVNGKEISRNDVLKFINDIGPKMAAQFQSPQGISLVIDELVNQELLYLDAVEVDMENDENFQKILQATKINLLKDYAINKIIAQAQVTEDELVEFYNANKAYFNKDESVKASHILVDNIEKANDIIGQINEGLSFGDAAKNFSSCPSKEVGGDLGDFTRGQMVPEFEEAAFSMDEGSISEPVKTQFGYHIIKLVEKHPVTEVSFEEAREQVYEQVLRTKQQQIYLDKVADLKTKYPVEMFN